MDFKTIRMRKLQIITSIAIILISCSEANNINELDSDDFETKQERVDILKKEIKCPSNFENAEFELFNVNGFSNTRILMPGASSWDYKFVVKTKPENIDKWIDGMIKQNSGMSEIHWMKEIIQERRNDWQANSKPEFYIRQNQNVEVIIYRTEGIIYKRVLNT